MRLNDFLDVLRAEFASAADDIDGALMSWMGAAPDEIAQHAEAVATTFGRLALVARMVGLEGQAVAVEQLRDAAQLAALADEAGMAATLGWLTAWRMAIGPCFELPGDTAAADALVDHFRLAPSPLPEPLLASLAELLRRAPSLPEDDADTRAAAFAAPQPDDVSLEVPPDVDDALYASFLEQSPDQLAVLGEAVRALARGACAPDELAEAQRVAHTFKGSGNIIGIRGIGRLAHRLEDVLDFAQSRGGALPAPMARDLVLAAAALEQMVAALRGEEPPPPDALQHLSALTDWARAIDDDSWEARCAASAEPIRSAPGASAPFAERVATEVDATGVPATSSSPSPPPTASTRRTAETAEPLAQLRVDATRLDRLGRRAGQHLVQQGRLADRLLQLSRRLEGLEATQSALDARLAELQAQIDRQGVSLQSRAEEAGQGFDPLEMDRYNELHSLARLAAEMVSDARDLARAAQTDTRELGLLAHEQEQALKLQHAELQDTRLVPFRQVVSRLQRNVAQTAAATGKQVQLVVQGEDVRVEASVLERLTEPLLHLLRNAVDHGIEAPETREAFGKPALGTVRLDVTRTGQRLRLSCRDDGRGLDLPAIHAKAIALDLVEGDAELEAADIARLILLPGFSTREAVSDISGRGVGMDVVAQRVRELKGQLDIGSEPFAGTTFTLELDATTGTAHVLVLQVRGETFALPTPAVVTALPAVAVHLDGQEIVSPAGRWPCRALDHALGLSDQAAPQGTRPVIVIRSGRAVLALEVDAVLETRELVLQDVGRLLRAMPGVSGGAIRANGHVVMLLDPEALVQGQARVNARAAHALREQARRQQRRALVVDDSHTVRRLMIQLLADAGWDVGGARDGFDALAQLARRPVDVVLTDLEMPNLNGLELTRQIKADPRLAGTPVLMITSRDTEKHRRSARDVGVDRYLTKPCTDDELLSSVQALAAGSPCTVF